MKFLSIALTLLSLLISFNAGSSSLTLPRVGMKGDWSYSGETGPMFWNQLPNPEYKGCGTSKRQSPIDIVTRHVIKNDDKGTIGDIVQSRQALYKVTEVPWNVKFDCKEEGQCGILEINGTTYSLLQVHFHSHSEHFINGKQYPFEIHMVHKSSDGKLAVVGILVKGTKDYCDATGSLHKTLKAMTSGRDIEFNFGEFIKKSSGYYNYLGGLTTPPCTDPLNVGIQWILQSAVSTVPRYDIRKYRRLVGVENWRPPQPLNGRVVRKVSC